MNFSGKNIFQRCVCSLLVLCIMVLFYAVIFHFSDIKSNVIFWGWIAIICGVIILQPTFENKEFRSKTIHFLSNAFLIIANIMWIILALGNNFHYDEAYTIGMISRDWKDIISVTAQDVHSPFYYFFLKLFWEALGGKWLPLTKLFSLIFMDLTLIIGRRSVRSLYSEEVECAWMLFACFMPPVIVQVASPRMYTMGLFFVTMASIYALKCYQADEKKNWILLTIYTVCGVYVHTFTLIEMFVIYFVLLGVLVWKKRHNKLLFFFLSGGIVSLCYIPWLIVLYHQFLRWSGKESGWGNTLLPLSGETIWIYLSEWFSALEAPSVLQTLFGVTIFLFVGYFSIEYIRSTKDIVPLLGVIIAAIVLMMAMWISLGMVPCFLGRYLFPIFGLIWLFLAVGISRIKNDWVRTVMILCIMLSGFATFRSEKILENAQGLKDCETFLAEYDSDADALMADNYFLLMMKVYHPEEKFLLYGPKQAVIPFDNVEGFTKWEQLDGVETVWYFRFEDQVVGNLNEKFEVVESKVFRYSYYDIVIDKYVRKQE